MSRRCWPTRPQPKVPFGPLRDALNKAGYSLLEASKRAGIDWAGIHRNQKTNTITVWKADHLAVTVLNQHPAEIYGDEWLDQTALDDPLIDLRIRALHESWQLRHELRQTG